MKKSVSGDFSVLYVEQGDDRATIFQAITEQKKPVVIMLAEQARVFQRPDDFTTLKHVKRQLDLPVVFVIPSSTHLAHLAARAGFPVYLSMDALADALSVGQGMRPRIGGKATNPLGSGEHGIGTVNNHGMGVKKTVPLGSGEHRTGGMDNGGQLKKTAPLGSGEHKGGPPGIAPTPVEAFNSRGGLRKPLPQALVEDDEVVPRRTAPLAPGSGPQVPLARRTSLTPPEAVRGQARLPLEPEVPAGQTYTEAEPAPFVRQVYAPVRPEPIERQTYTSARPEPVEQQIQAKLPQKPRRFPLFLVVLTFVLLLGIVGSFLVLPRVFPTNAPTPAPQMIIGHLAFTSSEQVNETTSQGIEDQVVVDMNNLMPPGAHKSYYAWLLGDKNLSDPPTTLLGKLQITNGSAHLLYPGDGQHNNLLLKNSRFLVTEEDATVTPIAPSPDQSTWRYYGEFSDMPINSPDNPKHFSFLDHLRHLLAADPTLDELELPGGLNNWFFKNTSKVLEWATGTRESWEETKDIQYVRGQDARILQYLDGDTFVGQDLPANAPLLVNERLARIGLLDVNGPNQEPPCYLDHIVHHLNGLLQAGGATKTLRTNISNLITAMNNVQQWLGKVRQDAQQIAKMSDDQLKQDGTLTLLNDMIDNTNHAYAGELDPSTNATRQGVIWIHDHMQTLATLDITRFAANGQSTVPQIMPNTKHARA